jgi:hypothetical protein
MKKMIKEVMLVQVLKSQQIHQVHIKVKMIVKIFLNRRMINIIKIKNKKF